MLLLLEHRLCLELREKLMEPKELRAGDFKLGSQSVTFQVALLLHAHAQLLRVSLMLCARLFELARVALLRLREHRQGHRRRCRGVFFIVKDKKSW